MARPRTQANICPRCNRPVVNFDEPPSGVPTCNPIDSPDCWIIEDLRIVDRILLVVEEMEQQAAADEVHCHQPPCEMAWGMRRVTNRLRETFNLAGFTVGSSSQLSETQQSGPQAMSDEGGIVQPTHAECVAIVAAVLGERVIDLDERTWPDGRPNWLGPGQYATQRIATLAVDALWSAGKLTQHTGRPGE